jgi:hypothetical protein
MSGTTLARVRTAGLASARPLAPFWQALRAVTATAMHRLAASARSHPAVPPLRWPARNQSSGRTASLPPSPPRSTAPSSNGARRDSPVLPRLNDISMDPPALSGANGAQSSSRPPSPAAQPSLRPPDSQISEPPAQWRTRRQRQPEATSDPNVRFGRGDSSPESASRRQPPGRG